MLPERYDLEIKVDVDEKIFSGSVKISINLQEEKTTFIILHAASSLNILSQNVTDSESKELTIKNDFRYAPLQFFVLEMEQPLTTGKYFLNFEFNSTLSTDMSGFYLSEYQSENGMKKLASTQFQVCNTSIDRKYDLNFDHFRTFMHGEHSLVLMNHHSNRYFM